MKISDIMYEFEATVEYDYSPETGPETTLSLTSEGKDTFIDLSNPLELDDMIDGLKYLIGTLNEAKQEI